MLERHRRGQAPDGFEPIPERVARLDLHVAVGEFLGIPATAVGDLDAETFYAALVLMRARGIVAKRRQRAAKPGRGR